LPNVTLAQGAYPTKTVRFLVPFPAGGINDILARIVAEKLQTKWGQPIVIENKTGADLAAHADPDGYTLFASAPGPLEQLSYKPEEFVPITGLGKVPNLFIVRKDFPANSVKELIDYAKANPGKVVFGSQGNGATPHLTANMFMNLTGTKMIHMPYRGETLVLQDMLGGHVDLFFGNVSAALALWRDGKIKVLAVTDTTRSAAMPDIPTSAEAGLPGLISAGWFAVVGPPKLPPALATQISEACVEALKLPDVQAKLRTLSVEPLPWTPAETAVFIKDEARRWGDVIKQTGVTVE
jgi:tripartite-type tricarboxylate transporter receptor subunit TctC